MHLLAINLYELGQFVRILLWVFIPVFVLVLLITTYIHHRRKRRAIGVVVLDGELLLAVEPIPDGEQPEGDNLYKGMLWVKEKFEEYRLQADEKTIRLKGELDQRMAFTEKLKEELVQAREKIAELTGKLESNMSLLMNIHKELDKSLEQAPAATPETAMGGVAE